jgi:hypothetical protein
VESAEKLVERVLESGRRFDYWESGMDLHLGEDFYECFIEYQSRMLKVFDRMSDEYGFQVVKASRSINQVAATLRRGVARVIDKGTPKELKGLADLGQLEKATSSASIVTVADLPRAKKTTP